MASRLFHPLLIALLMLGAYLRASQFGAQVLLDDEWHAVHQLLSGKTPRELFFTLGIADYSVPLGILYYWLSHWFGLSEFAMRLPMLVASLLTLAGATAWVARRFEARTTLVFTLLLALSPVLVIYAHTARPYALTLLLGYLALFSFYRFWNAPLPRYRWASLYTACAALCVWLHLISGPFVIAPFVLEGSRLLARRDWRRLARLGALGLTTAALMLLLALPPVLADTQALAGKTGEAAIEWITGIDAWFIWFGSGADWVVAFLFACAALGMRAALVREPLLQAAALGVVLTLLMILAARPDWVHHPITLARYLLPFLPLLLLASACGMNALLEWSAKWRALRLASAAVAGLALAAYALTNPLWRLVASPNSEMTHSVFQFDFRPGHNRVAQYQQAQLRPSPFWSQLALAPPDSLRIAAAPFYFESFNWDAPRWEQSSGQRVFPAYLSGYCVSHRFGEVPDNDLYRFQNAYYVKQLREQARPAVDWLVYLLPFTGFSNGRDAQLVGDELQHCLAQLREDFGTPDYEDDALLAWRLGRE